MAYDTVINKRAVSKKHPRRAKKKYRHSRDYSYRWGSVAIYARPRCPDCGLPVVGLADFKGLTPTHPVTVRRRCLGCKRRWTVTISVNMRRSKHYVNPDPPYSPYSYEFH